jgi:hypothetical protein
MNPTTWDGSRRWLKEIADRRKELDRILQQSNDHLAPLQEPLHLNLGSHRAVRWYREEVYSDWLAWVVNQLGSDPEAVLRLFGVSMDSLGPRKKPRGRLYARREFPVPKGHDGQSGRLDLLIRDDDDQDVLVVEVKVTSAEAADTEKGAGYTKQLPDIPAVLLATDGVRNEYPGRFQLRRWRETCIALRREARRSIADGNTMLAAMMLVLASAAEANLLGYGESHWTLREAKEHIQESMEE